MPSINKYKQLVTEIKLVIEQARRSVVRYINSELLLAYWNIGKLIVEKETHDNMHKKSSREMMIGLSKELTRHLGKGFSRSNLVYMRLFFIQYKLIETKPGKIEIIQPFQRISGSGQTVSDQNHKRNIIGQTLSDQKQKSIIRRGNHTLGTIISLNLSWSHYNELLKIENAAERNFYQQTSISENWSVREMQRQIDTALYERIALSKKPKDILRLAHKGHYIKTETDITRDPYILEFLKIPESTRYTEKQLEQKIIDNLQRFILELGKGFTFVGRQFRITLGNKHHHVDLVFYHRILRCFVLFDLKIQQVEHHHIGQMNMYLNYFEAEENSEGDGQPIGIILSRHKNDIVVEYALKGISNKIFVSKYQLYLPEKKVLQNKLRELLDDAQPLKRRLVKEKLK